MKNLATLTRLRCWVVAWFVLALGVSMASPLVRPGTLELVCVGAPVGAFMGASVQLVESTDGVAADMDALDPHCLLCLVSGAPPPVPLLFPAAFALPAHSIAMDTSTTPVFARTWRPPARAPPFVSSPSQS